MNDVRTFTELWTRGLSAPDEASIAAVAGTLADGVATVSPLGPTQGKDAVLAGFGQSPLTQMFAQGTWSDVAVDGDVGTATCTFAKGAPVGGVTVKVTVRDAKIARVETAMIPAPSPEPVPVRLTGTIAQNVNGALASGTPVVVAYVDADGRAHLSLRGTTQVFDETSLGIWVRNPQGGLPAALDKNPHVTLMYRNPATRSTYQFYGRGRVDDAEDVRTKVYDNSPEVERNFDPQRRGLAVIVELDRVEGRDADGPVLMVR